ncbi:MAG: ROK family protein [Bacillota bacterium]
MMATIGVDLGGTRLRAGVVAEGKLRWKTSGPTEAERGPRHVLDKMQSMVEEAMRQSEEMGLTIAGLGVGSPGPLDARTGVVFNTPNLPGWTAVSVAETLQQRFGLPTFLDNDANVAALGEWLFGAGQGCRNLVYITVSTGIGCGVIAEGQLLQGEVGGVAELGHTCVQAAGGAPCTCGRSGCLEAYASGTGMVRRLERRLGTTSQPSLLQGEEITPPAIALAARAGDELARGFLQETSYFLGIGLSNAVTIFNPEVLVLGGGLTALQTQLIEPALATMWQTILPGLGRNLRVTSPLLGEDSGLIGAAALAQWRMEGTRSAR